MAQRGLLILSLSACTLNSGGAPAYAPSVVLVQYSARTHKHCAVGNPGLYPDACVAQAMPAGSLPPEAVTKANDRYQQAQDKHICAAIRCCTDVGASFVGWGTAEYVTGHGSRGIYPLCAFGIPPAGGGALDPGKPGR